MEEKIVIAIMGIVLSGKTTLGKELSQRTGIHHIDIDDGPARCAPSQEPEPYSSDEKRDRERRRMAVAYSVLHEAITANVTAGFPIIVSAAYSSRKSQEYLCRAVEQNGGKLKLIWCTFEDTDEEINRRIRERLANGDPGGCRSVEHYLDDKSRYEGTDIPHLKVSMMSENVNGAAKAALAYIQEPREGL
ncbi:MAG: AAA family ATPase [Candidatus Jorgensenbacteria bacterium]|nr:AAA family ATPase [Candidatus Jorgensenbacteria bacterium]